MYLKGKIKKATYLVIYEDSFSCFSSFFFVDAVVFFGLT